MTAKHKLQESGHCFTKRNALNSMSTEEKMDVDETVAEKVAAPQPSASAESASKYPDMALAQKIHKATVAVALVDAAEAQRVGIVDTLQDTVMTEISQELENPSLYRHLQSILPYDGLTDADLAVLDEKHAKHVKELEVKVEEAKESAGDMEVLDARLEIARFAAKSLSKEEAIDAYEKVLQLPKLSTGKQIDALMEESRVASFYGDTKKNAELIEKASKLAEDGGDWDRRNRLKVYNALSKLLARDVKEAASLLIDCVATFSCGELCPYPEFVVYTIISNILFLPRTELKSKIIDGPDILSVANKIPVVMKLVNALYDCDYKAYLHAMVEVQPILVADRFLQPHSGYIMRELHVLGYKQFLDSYKSVTLESMAESFGVSVAYLDLQLSRFIAAGRLTAKVDKYNGVVETNRPDLKNTQYRDMIQKGDHLLNRIQKLSRVVDL
jgi:26S proteasome regulatory subunit N7